MELAQFRKLLNIPVRHDDRIVIMADRCSRECRKRRRTRKKLR